MLIFLHFKLCFCGIFVSGTQIKSINITFFYWKKLNQFSRLQKLAYYRSKKIVYKRVFYAVSWIESRTNPESTKKYLKIRSKFRSFGQKCTFSNKNEILWKIRPTLRCSRQSFLTNNSLSDLLTICINT